MNRPVVVCVLSLLAMTACHKLKGKSAAAGSGAATPAPDSMKVDKVTGEDGPIATDGAKDGAIALTIDGPVSALMVLTTDKDGKPEGGQQWDTYVKGQKAPAAAKPAYEDGDSTWQVGVFENGKLVNDKTGALTPLAAGPHTLTLYCADSGYFTKDNHFVVFAERPDHTLVRSNVFTF